jgi:hypothetical protein
MSETGPVLMLGAGAGAIYLARRPGRFFSWAELLHSNTADELGILNRPDELSQWLMLWGMTRFVLDPLRAATGCPLRINNAFRSRALNDALYGAASNSRHMLGRAADVSSDCWSASQMAAWLYHQKDMRLGQVIIYDTESRHHLHVTWDPFGSDGRSFHIKTAEAATLQPWSP